MGILIVVRHGFSETNKRRFLSHDIEGYPLTKEGKEYILKASKDLKKLDNIKEIISSPILRARQTAEIISDATGLKIKIDERLAERQMGNYNNKKIPDDEKQDKTDYNWHTKEVLNGYPNGLEKWEDIMDRTNKFLESLPANENFIVVTHGDIIKAIIASVLDLDEFGVWGIRANHGHFTVIDRERKRLLLIGSPILSDNIIEKIKNECTV
ncbi:MAG: Phosphoglycerate mutase [Candidatus Parvarchaeum acidophilus ARMAN-5]|jgi:probable phosphoglycerate mutase|uniref:Phosphoglycerate mutase n=1 Tax=Candidatus Parvarchaeum acidophilus ARMAN-5 TaxID=662762 RepID=D6GUS2_PARA5|nr:MAG: Phosphoglycerate mutase [Candidatus Parvarchaeum acidophilus ARMAN-5]